MLAGALDRGTRLFWRATGHRVDLTGEHRWLAAPMHAGPTVGDGWLAAAAAEAGGEVRADVPGAGLLADLGALDGPGFSAATVHPEVRGFYEHTADWRMEVWAQWSPLAQPAGDLLARLFGRRVQQLALPVRPLDVAHGMDSRVVLITGQDGRQVSAGWLRTLRPDGGYVYSGCYSTRLLPGATRPSVHVAFPLDQGNVQVFLEPRTGPDRTLELVSPPGRFGTDGAYVVVRDGGATYAARVPIHEHFRLYVDGEGVLRTDHRLDLWSMTALRLHYKLTRGDSGTGRPGGGH
ncbi:hypothetical protein PSA01_02210 [Pseudonocardia saturnea]|uniref:YndJ-like protein n=1 Tax=Pseudonocardia saturnea TaxID=33909 RepID=A0ABQ0RR99_9PSEU|nr:hypothetical protein Pdca_32380 [Pseudonocardia autotrophica]GEC23192.1 hypothetical protein PSA01_02210 [Pseudonocardia saturnea]